MVTKKIKEKVEVDVLSNSEAIIAYSKKLFKAADKLRKNIDAAEYKHPVLGLIFLKYISDSFEEHYDKLLEQKSSGADPEEKSEYIGEHLFWVPQEARWNYILERAKTPLIGKIIDDAMLALEHQNDSLKGVLPKDYARPKLDKSNLGGLIDLFSDIRIGGKKNSSRDTLGRIYEYFLAEFASEEGKNAGQFYTPSSVVKLLVKMLQPSNGRLYEPCCGSGGMIVQSEALHKKNEELSFYGQESNETTWRLCKMNLAIRGIDGDIRWNNQGTFLNDEHKSLKADFALANPHFNDKDWSGEQLSDDARWVYGVPPPKNANYAWIQHIISHLSDNGRAGIVMANSALASMTDNEGEIRKAIIQNDLLDCIVALPPQLFFSTQIEASLWFISKNQKKDIPHKKGKILLIDARNMGHLVSKTKRDFSNDDYDYISNCYFNWRNDDRYNDEIGFCKEISHTDLEKFRYILSPGRYVGFKQEKISLKETMAKINNLTLEYDENTKLSNNLDKKVKEVFKKFEL